MLLVAESQPLCLKRLERVQIEARIGEARVPRAPDELGRLASQLNPSIPEVGNEPIQEPSLGKSLAPVERRDSSAVASFEAASGTIGPKFLDGFLELAMSIAQSPKLRTAILQSVAARNALHVPAQGTLVSPEPPPDNGLGPPGNRPTPHRCTRAEQIAIQRLGITSHSDRLLLLSLNRYLTQCVPGAVLSAWGG